MTDDRIAALEEAMRFPDHSDLGVVTIEGVGEFRVTMDRIGTVAADEAATIAALRAALEEKETP